LHLCIEYSQSQNCCTSCLMMLANDIAFLFAEKHLGVSRAPRARAIMTNYE
jgi:hypothetical protein